jgi:DNA-binding CsgD family transcriptional regulator
LGTLDAGASGYVHKSRGVAALISAVERVLLGNVVVDIPPATEIRRSARANGAERLPIRLTTRERECLAMLVEGLDTAAMVVKLGVSRTTVRTHVQAVLNKLGVHSRLEAASFAVRSGMLGVGYDDILLRKRRPDVPAFVEFRSGGGPANGSRRMATESAAEPRRASPAVRALGPRPRLAHPPDAPVSTADRAG